MPTDASFDSPESGNALEGPDGHSTTCSPKRGRRARTVARCGLTESSRSPARARSANKRFTVLHGADPQQSAACAHDDLRRRHRRAPL
jgi:hypothetical protein